MTDDIDRSAVLAAYGPAGYPVLPDVDPPVLVIHRPAPRSGPDRAANPSAPRWSWRRRRRGGRRSRLIAAAVVTVLLGAVFVRCSGIGPTESPEALVRAVFAALTARDGARLGQLAPCGSPLCTAAGLTDGYQPPEQLQFTSGRDRSTPTGKSRDVTVRYTVSGTTHQETITVHRYRQRLLGHVWMIINYPGGRLDLRSSAYDTLRLAGVGIVPNPVTADHQPGPVQIWAPPGAYTVTAAGDPLFEPVTATATVADGVDPPAVTVKPALRPDVLPQIEQQIRTRIDGCAALHDLEPDTDRRLGTPHDCPFSHAAGSPFTEAPTWTVDRYPVIAVDVDETGIVTVRTVTPGAATVRYRVSLSVIRRWTDASATEPFDVGGHVVLANGAVTWTR